MWCGVWSHLVELVLDHLPVAPSELHLLHGHDVVIAGVPCLVDDAVGTLEERLGEERNGRECECKEREPGNLELKRRVSEILAIHSRHCNIPRCNMLHGGCSCSSINLFTCPIVSMRRYRSMLHDFFCVAWRRDAMSAERVWRRG